MTDRVESGAGLSAAFERLSTHSSEWEPRRVMDEGLDLVRDASWADSCSLYEVDEVRAVEVASRPRLDDDPVTVGVEWFPWGLAPVAAERFLLVQDATALPRSPDGDVFLGDLGIRSCLHLPILERQRAIGALHLHWTSPRLVWDDDRGRLLRVLGRFLLSRCPTDDR